VATAKGKKHHRQWQQHHGAVTIAWHQLLWTQQAIPQGEIKNYPTTTINQQ